MNNSIQLSDILNGDYSNNQIIKQFIDLYVKAGNILLDDVLKENSISMNKSSILTQHEQFCNIWQASDGRWKTKVPDATKPDGKRLVAKANKENLENFIVEYYQAQNENTRKSTYTLKDLYPLWVDKQINQEKVSMRTVRIYDSNWKKYYKPYSITSIPVTKLTDCQLEEWSYDIINTFSMTKKKYDNIAVIVRGCLKYAKKNGIIKYNPFTDVEISSKAFSQPTKHKDEERIFIHSEWADVTLKAYEDFQETGSINALSVPLAYELGCRVGELAALKFSDIDEASKKIHIQRMETKIENRKGVGNYAKTKFNVVDNTKTPAGNRKIYLTDTALNILHTIRNWQVENHCESDFIFVDKDGERSNSRKLVYRIEKCCRLLGIKTRRMHAIRRTFVSALYEKKVSITTIAKLAGHASPLTTLQCYIHDLNDDDAKREQFENALRG